VRKKNDYYVYVIAETKTMKPIYIGKGKNNRLNWHIFAIKSGYHYNKKLSNKINKITENFTKLENISIFKDSVFEKECDALHREKELISMIGIDKLCNLTLGGDGSSLTKDSMEKIIKARRLNGKPWHTEQTKINIGNGRRGKPHSQETKEKLRNMFLGNKSCRFGVNHTEETKKLMSQNHADIRGEKNPFYGKHHTQAVKDYFRLKYGHVWVILHNGNKIDVVGKSAIKKYVEEYNKNNNTSISYKSLLMYKHIKKDNIQILKKVNNA